MSVRELLEEPNDNLGPVIKLSLTVPQGEQEPRQARFTVTVSNVRAEEPSHVDELDRGAIVATTAQFMEPFITHMTTALKYRMEPFSDKGTDVLYDETVDTGVKTVDEIKRDFEQAIKNAKRNMGEIRFGKHGQQKNLDDPRLW